jgi:hypothetical protein
MHVCLECHAPSARMWRTVVQPQRQLLSGRQRLVAQFSSAFVLCIRNRTRADAPCIVLNLNTSFVFGSAINAVSRLSGVARASDRCLTTAFPSSHLCCCLGTSREICQLATSHEPRMSEP